MPSGARFPTLDAMSLKEKLRADMTTAMKARDELRTATLRMVLTAITNEEVAGKAARELSDDEVLKVVAREAKKRREAAEAFDEGNRPELAERERAEGVVLDEYLPAQLSDDELAGSVRAAIASTGAVGSAGDGSGHEGRAAAGRRARRGWPDRRRGARAARQLNREAVSALAGPVLAAEYPAAISWRLGRRGRGRLRWCRRR